MVNLSIETSERFNALDSRSQLIVDSLLERRKEFSEELRDQTLAIAQLLSRSEVAILDHLEESKVRILGTMQEALRDTNLSPTVNDQLLRSKCAEELCRERTEKSLLEGPGGLQFTAMMQRQNEVTEAYRKTFEWIYQDPVRNSRPWSSFINWLQYENGIYWINGKAGSGKSTLMRYICDQRLTMTLLKAWSGATPLTIASFFFWNSGTREQRSQSGFLRAILYEVLSQHPELLPNVLPWQWAKRYSRLASEKPILSDQTRDDWPMSRLKEAFAKLCEQKTFEMKICIFLDGLDEYEGDHESIAELFGEITTTSPDIKICVSSRPLLVFGEIFSSRPSLRLQDLSLQDIKFYVNENLRKHRRFRQLLEKEPIKAPQLVKDIVGRADGVFLWVRLVVDSLREGLGNHDEIEDLQERLDELPGDLEQLYSHMWGRTHKMYRTRASRIFQIVRAATNQGAVIRHRDDEYGPLTTIALSFAEEESTSINGDPSIRDLDPAYIKERCDKMEAVLKTRCAGLLEVQAPESRLYESWEGRVQYLHRTARDYLESPGVWSSLTASTSGTGFNPHLCLLRSCVLQLKHTITSPMSKSLWVTAFAALEDAYYIDRDTNIPYTTLLDELDSTMDFRVNGLSRPLNGHRDHWINHTFNPYSQIPAWKSDFLSLAVQCGLTSYVRQKLGKGSKILKSKEGRSYLEYATDFPDTDWLLPPANPDMETIILEHAGQGRNSCSLM